MLKDTTPEIEGLRTIENKISFSTEMAGLMWFHDEKEARQMFETVIENFVNLISRYNAEISAMDNIDGDTEVYTRE